MRFKVMGACLAAMVTCMPVAQAQTVTIGEVIQVLGDLNALMTICPDLEGDSTVLFAYLKANGINDDIVSEKGPYSDDMNSATKLGFETRKAMSVDENCKNALGLYGEKGTVLKGMLERKSGDVATK